MGLAYWILDDGSLQNKGLHLNTYGFSSGTKIKNYNRKYICRASIKCSIHKHKKGKEFIFGLNLLRKNISEYMHKYMLYKINCKRYTKIIN